MCVPLTGVHCGGHVSGTVAGLMKAHPSSSRDATLDYTHGGKRVAQQ